MKTVSSLEKFIKLGVITSCIALSGLLQQSALAEEHCYDFSEFDYPSPSVQYPFSNGSQIPTHYGTIDVTQYYFYDNVPTQSAAQFVYVLHGNLARGKEISEARLYLASLLVTPEEPVTHVSIKYAENLVAPRANIGVNGDLHVVNGGLVNINGVDIGDGSDMATVTITYEAGDYFNYGTINIDAIEPGVIRDFTIGGQQVFVDDLCMQWK